LERACSDRSGFAVRWNASATPDADAYFQSRPRDSRIGAWASLQSRPLEGRFALEKAVALYAAKFGLGEVPRPPHWTGFRLKPSAIEFWHDRPFRLHDRVVFRRTLVEPHSSADGTWTRERLYP
jgi:pyridoxamine 5'-phosphate oxidase